IQTSKRSIRYVDSQSAARPEEGRGFADAHPGGVQRGVHSAAAKPATEEGRAPDRRNGRREIQEAWHGPSHLHGKRDGYGYLLPRSEQSVRQGLGCRRSGDIRGRRNRGKVSQR